MNLASPHGLTGFSLSRLSIPSESVLCYKRCLVPTAPPPSAAMRLPLLAPLVVLAPSVLAATSVRFRTDVPPCPFLSSPEVVVSNEAQFQQILSQVRDAPPSSSVVFMTYGGYTRPLILS